MIASALAVALTALGVSTALPAVLIPLLRRARAFDRPTARSSHSGVAIRGLGIGVLVALLTGVAVAITRGAGSTLLLSLTALSATAITLIGLREDTVGIPSAGRAALQLLTGSAVALAIVVALGASWWAIPLIGLIFAASVNIANFMDGVNGISGLHGVAVGLGYAIIGVVWEQPWLVMVGYATSASFAGFLVWNLARPGTFLGDAGSYLLGGVIAVSGGIAVIEGAPVLAVVAPSLVYVADTTATLVRRMANAEPWYEAHRSHAYQRLTDVGVSHVGVAGIVAAATCLVSAAGIIAAHIDWPWASIPVAIMVTVLLLYLFLPALLGHRPSPPSAPDPPNSAPPEGWSVPRSPRVIVVGASGFVGSHVAAQLNTDGASVTNVRAPRVLYSGDPTAVGVLAAAREHAGRASIEEIMRGADVVVNAAGLASPDRAASDALLGANALLPVLLLHAARGAGVARFVHLSSVAVQGRRAVLDESSAMSPFSAYSRSKALGELALLHLADEERGGAEIVILRATSVQGPGRPTTQALRRVARSRFSSVASPPSRPTVVSSVTGLSSFVSLVCRWPDDVPTIVLQPSEGVTTAAVLAAAGGRPPRVLPVQICRSAIWAGYIVSALIPGLTGTVRRLEVMWFGQAQDAAWARSQGLDGIDHVTALLSDDRGSP